MRFTMTLLLAVAVSILSLLGLGQSGYANILQNPGFEHIEAGAPIGWEAYIAGKSGDWKSEVVQVTPKAARTGGFGVKLSGQTSFIRQTVNVQGGQPYELSAWVKGDGSTSDMAPIALGQTDFVAISEVLAGTRKEANAVWWGFDPEDSTESIQAAIDSGASRVIIPNVGADWVVRPITLRSNLELVFEEGVVVTAKKGEYHGRTHSVFNARDVENLTIHYIRLPLSERSGSIP